MTRRFAALLVLALCLGALPVASAVDDPPKPQPAPRPPCGAATDPVCWGSKFACQLYGPLVEDTPLKCENFTSDAVVTIAALDALGRSPSSSRLDILDGSGDEAEKVCKNFGVIIMVTGTGTNYYCTDGECENAGIIVMIGDSDSCYGEGYGTVCVAESCVVGPNGVIQTERLLRLQS